MAEKVLQLRLMLTIISGANTLATKASITANGNVLTTSSMD